MTELRCTLEDSPVLAELEKVDEPGANGGTVQFHRALRLHAVDNSVNVSVDAVPTRRRHVRRFSTGAGIDLSKEQARQLRDALDHWIGDDTEETP